MHSTSTSRRAALVLLGVVAVLLLLMWAAESAIAAPPGSTTEYLALQSSAAWVTGAVGAGVLLGAAGICAMARRRGCAGRPAH